jgi:hypothetical protein
MRSAEEQFDVASYRPAARRGAGSAGRARRTAPACGANTNAYRCSPEWRKGVVRRESCRSRYRARFSAGVRGRGAVTDQRSLDAVGVRRAYSVLGQQPRVQQRAIGELVTRPE